MSQVTLYLDEATRELVERAAKASGLSQSRWVAEAIRRQAEQNWPREFLELAGSDPDFPLREDAPGLPNDTPRVDF